MAQITVAINGRSFRMACDDGEEERLTALAGRFDASIDMLRESFGEIGDLRLTVMAGIMVTDELNEAEKKLKAAVEDVEKLRVESAEVSQRAKANEAELAKKLDEASSRIAALAARLSAPPGEAQTSEDE